jgi:hypothetical protein
MPRDPEQILGDAKEWAGIADVARTLNDLVQGLAELVTTGNVRALERLVAQGPGYAVDELGRVLVEVMAGLTRFGEPIGELVSTADARITTLRIEVAGLTAELGGDE